MSATMERLPAPPRIILQGLRAVVALSRSIPPIDGVARAARDVVQVGVDNFAGVNLGSQAHGVALSNRGWVPAKRSGVSKTTIALCSSRHGDNENTPGTTADTQSLVSREFPGGFFTDVSGCPRRLPHLFTPRFHIGGFGKTPPGTSPTYGGMCGRCRLVQTWLTSLLAASVVPQQGRNTEPEPTCGRPGSPHLPNPLPHAVEAEGECPRHRTPPDRPSGGRRLSRSY
jgi:hypothetical protein